LCEFPNEGEPEIVYPGDYTPGGSGGGGTVAGSGPSGPVGGGTGGTTHCFLISFTMTHTITYTNGNSHTKTKRYTLDTCTGIITVNNKGTKTSKDGNNQTETYNENDCCSFGALGIMDDNESQNDPCKELKNLVKPELADIKPKIDYLKTKVLENKEFGKDFKNVGEDYFSFESTQPQNSNTIEHTIGGFFYGAAHTHPFFSSYAMFSWGDVKFLSDLYQNVHPSKADNVFYTLVCMKKVGTSWEPWTYTIKIDDPVKLKNKLNSDLANTFGVNQGFRVEVRCSRTNAGAPGDMILGINSSISLSGIKSLGYATMGTGILGCTMTRGLSIKSATTTVYLAPVSFTDYTFGNPSISNIDWTQNQYFIVSFWNNNSTTVSNCLSIDIYPI
jgi:hypothetical protein